MKKFSKDQSGFSTVEAVLAIVIIIVVIGVGLYVAHAAQSSDSTLDSANVNSHNVTPQFKDNKKADSSSTTTTSTSTSSTAMPSGKSTPAPAAN